MRSEHAHVCLNKDHDYRAEGVGVAGRGSEAPGNQFIAMQHCRRLTIVVSFQKVAGCVHSSGQLCL